MGGDAVRLPREVGPVTLGELLVDVWGQVLERGSAQVTIDGRRVRVGRTRSQGLRTVAFVYQEHLIEGIEQNPAKASRWAQLAREGKRIMQFSCRHRYFANVCEGALLRYPAWEGLGLPE